MKCKAKLYFGYSKKSKRPTSKLLISLPEEYEDTHIAEIYEKSYVIDTIVDKCGGTILVDISAKEFPEFGGTYVDLVVELKCSRCKNTIHKNLFNKYNINKFLTNVVENL